MAEDQGVDGDRWTAQASKLLTKLGWEKIADSNIDILGSDGKKHGIDSLFRYVDTYQNSHQGVFLEAKRYATNSFSEAKIGSWINSLYKKIPELRRSPQFNNQYPAMADSNPQNGLLMMWFHDVQNYQGFRPKLQEAMRAVNTPRGRKSSMNVRLFALSNHEILQLASLIDTKERWENSNQDNTLNFYYPSSMGVGKFTRELPHLNIEYIFSKFVVAKASSKDGSHHQPAYVIFYFGELDSQSFATLNAALMLHNFLPDEKCRVDLYYYRRSSEFRKVEPDIRAMLKLPPSSQFEISSMSLFSDLPGWMNDSTE